MGRDAADNACATTVRYDSDVALDCRHERRENFLRAARKQNRVWRRRQIARPKMNQVVVASASRVVRALIVIVANAVRADDLNEACPVLDSEPGGR